MSQPSDVGNPQPCPSCGESLAIPDYLAFDGAVWQMWCECGLQAPTAETRRGAVAQWNMLSMTSVDQKLVSMQARVGELAADIGPTERQAMLAELPYLYRCRDGLRAALTVLTEIRDITPDPQTYAETRAREMAHDARRRIAWPMD